MSASLQVDPDDPLLAEVAARGFVLMRGGELAARLGEAGGAAALDAFAASWERLETDGFMADGGRYRRRRLANYTARAGVPGHLRGPHRPHFQAVVHNSLNGGVERWFAPIEAAVGDGATLHGLLDLGRSVADRQRPGCDWFVEVHQFRIEAVAGAPGYPTPEGVHHDGVDHVLIGMIARTNLVGGETLITNNAGGELARFTLQDRLDTAFIDDARVMHGVTPVQPAEAAAASCRDVLVVTWKRA
ncbi:MAG: hypothetical protein JWP04_3899 [Belnapia sp.]|nr:hypothetical protein [Belnapia sp.]